MSTRTLVLQDDDGNALATYEFPRVTSIIDAVLNKPALPAYYYRMALTGVADLHERYGDKLPHDTDSLRQLLGQHDLDPWSARDTAADRGNNIHEALERMVLGTYDRALYAEHLHPALDALEGWWAQEGGVFLSEAYLTSFAQRYTGSADLIEPSKRIIDLKTSNNTYWSHHLQLEAYRQAWNEEHPDEEIPQGETYLLWVKPGINKNGFRVIRGNASPRDWQLVRELYYSMKTKGVKL